VGYGIGTILAPFKELEEGLMQIYYDMLSLGGVRKSVRRELRQLDGGFYGINLPHPGIEYLLGQVNKLLLCYGIPTRLGKHQQVSMELLLVEAGVSPQPFLESYTWYSKWVTHSWLKSLWEKLDLFQVKVEIHDTALCTPRANNRWLMKVLIAKGYRLVWATKLSLAAIGLVFPALVLEYKSINCSMYQVPVPTLFG
jgi:hypothetical protein